MRGSWPRARQSAEKPQAARSLVDDKINTLLLDTWRNTERILLRADAEHILKYLQRALRTVI